MNNSNENVDYYFFFPYLKCSSKLTISGIDLYPSDESSIIDSDINEMIKTISQNFFMSEKYRIKNMIAGHIKENYDLASLGYKEERHLEFSKILKIRELFIYLYSNLHPTFLIPFLDNNASNVFIFRKEKLSYDKYESNNNLIKISQNEIGSKVNEGYSGLLNDRTLLKISKNERILPPYPSFNQNYYQDLFADINRINQNSVFNFITNESKLNVLFSTNRLMRSLMWYNKSINDNISDQEQLINLSVSFESLLDLEKDKNITSRFKDSINILLGNNTKLNLWIDQFYTARSEIVHRGYANELFYSTPQKKGENLRYRDLISYGRRIFQILFNSILTSEHYKQSTNLEELFISNNERIQILIRRINKKDDVIETLKENNSLLDEIIKYKYVGEEKIAVKDIFHLLLKTIESVITHFEDEKLITINEFITEKDIEKQLVMYFEIHKILTHQNELPELVKVDSICWHYLMFNVFAAMED